MTGQEILRALGDVDQKYYAEARQRAQGVTSVQETESVDTWHTEAVAFEQKQPKKHSILPLITTIGASAACIALMFGVMHFLNLRSASQGGESSLPEAVTTVSTTALQEIDITATNTTTTTTPGPVPLTLDDVIRLSQKGEALTWSDFAQYEYTDFGSGLYFYLYPIDDCFRLLIGGVPEATPLYMLLEYTADADTNICLSIDIRTEDVETFIAQCLDPGPEVLPVAVQQTEAASSWWSDAALSQDMMVLRQASDCNALTDSVFQDLSLPDTLKQDAYYEENVCILVALRTGSGGKQFGICFAELTADGVLELRLSEYSGVGECVVTSYYFMLTVPRAHLPEIKTLSLSVDCYDDPIGDAGSYQYYLNSLPEKLYLTLPDIYS